MSSIVLFIQILKMINFNKFEYYLQVEVMWNKQLSKWMVYSAWYFKLDNCNLK